MHKSLVMSLCKFLIKLKECNKKDPLNYPSIQNRGSLEDPFTNLLSRLAELNRRVTLTMDVLYLSELRRRLKYNRNC